MHFLCLRKPRWNYRSNYYSRNHRPDNSHGHNPNNIPDHSCNPDTRTDLSPNVLKDNPASNRYQNSLRTRELEYPAWFNVFDNLTVADGLKYHSDSEIIHPMWCWTFWWEALCPQWRALQVSGHATMAPSVICLISSVTESMTAQMPLMKTLQSVVSWILLTSSLNV